MPINEYFYLKVRGVWKNTRNQFDQISYHLIYAFKVIPKLVVTSLVPSSTILLKGDSLSIQSNVEFYNMKTYSNVRSY